MKHTESLTEARKPVTERKVSQGVNDCSFGVLIHVQEYVASIICSDSLKLMRIPPLTPHPSFNPSYKFS